MTFPILRREDTEYCPWLMCESCKEHTRHMKGAKVNWAFTETSIQDLKFSKFPRVSKGAAELKSVSVTFRTAWECENCRHQRVGGA